MKSIQIYSIVFLLSFSIAKAQDGLVRQYQFNNLAFNPAFTGENGIFSVRALLGQQFNGSIRFNQINQILAIDGQLYNQGGLGFRAYRSNEGNIIGTGLNGSYSKGFDIGDFKLKLGINAGLINRNQISNTIGQRIAAFTGAGLVGYYKGIFVGVSKPMIAASRKIADSKPMFYQLGYIFNQEESQLAFNVNTLFYSYSGANNLDFNAKLWFNKRVGLGVSYRNNEIYQFLSNDHTLVPSLEYKLYNTVNIGLSYDNNSMKSVSGVSGDLSLSGIFQLYFRYTSNPDKGESTYFNKF